MNHAAVRRYLVREQTSQLAALGFLLLLGLMALAGPSGFLAWSEYRSTLEKRQAAIAQLEQERDVLANRVALLDPEKADPDLVTELLRENLNVAHPDEYVMEIERP